MADACPRRFAGARRRFSQDVSHPEIVYEPGKCISCDACVRIAAAAGEPLGHERPRLRRYRGSTVRQTAFGRVAPRGRTLCRSLPDGRTGAAHGPLVRRLFTAVFRVRTATAAPL